MRFLTEVSLKIDYHTLPKGLTIELNDVVLLVGEQGCGKSSLLDVMSNNDRSIIDYKVSGDIPSTGVASFYFDTEKMNPRVTDPQRYTTPSGANKGIGLVAAVSSRFQSHGEVLREFTVNRLYQAKDSVILLDEPEAALSLKNQYRLVEEIKAASNTNQIIIATHSLVLIQAFDMVYDLEHKKWKSSKKFIKEQVGKK